VQQTQYDQLDEYKNHFEKSDRNLTTIFEGFVILGELGDEAVNGK
jgi:hypothetical protein